MIFFYLILPIKRSSPNNRPFILFREYKLSLSSKTNIHKWILTSNFSSAQNLHRYWLSNLDGLVSWGPTIPNRYRSDALKDWAIEMIEARKVNNTRYPNSAHHIFPRVPRHRLRELRGKVENFCQKYGRTYHSASFWDTNVKTLKCLKKAALEARSGKLIKFEDSMIWEGMCAKG